MEECAGLPWNDGIKRTARTECHDWPSGGHGLHRRDSEIFFGREDKCGGIGDHGPLFGFTYPSEELDRGSSESLKACTVTSFAQDLQWRPQLVTCGNG